jgi:hypothetical protein
VNTATQYLPPERETLDKRLEAADRPGQHLWIMTAAWLIADPASAYDPSKIKLMDRENLVTLAGPGCWKCEKEYSAAMAKRKCLGTLG